MLLLGAEFSLDLCLLCGLQGCVVMTSEEEEGEGRLRVQKDRVRKPGMLPD